MIKQLKKGKKNSKQLVFRFVSILFTVFLAIASVFTLYIRFSESNVVTAKIISSKEKDRKIEALERIKNVDHLEINTKKNLQTAKGQSLNLSAIPLDKRNNIVPGVLSVWETSDSAIVEVDSNGRAMAVGEGFASITATAGDVKETITVKVKKGTNDSTGQSIVIGNQPLSLRNLPSNLQTNLDPNYSPVPYLNDVGFPVGKTHPVGTSNPAAMNGGETLGDENFTFNVPLVNLPGRGINVNLGLTYNSRLWRRFVFPGMPTTNGDLPPHVAVYYNDYYDSPAPGFQLGFGHLDILEGLVAPDGTQHPLDFDINAYPIQTELHTQDGTFTKVRLTMGAQSYASAVAYFIDGTKIDYAAGISSNNVLYPVKINDRNGNYILINYVNNIGPKISNIQDTLGRFIRFHYDSSGNLVTITVPGFDNSPDRQLVRFYYDNLMVIPSFHTQEPYCWTSPVICDVYAYTENSGTINQPAIKTVLKYIYFPGDQTGYRYDYSSYGMIHTISNFRGLTVSSSNLNQIGATPSGGSVNAWTKYNYPETPSNLTAYPPSYTRRTDEWVGRPDADTVPSPYSTFAAEYTIEQGRGGDKTTRVTDPYGITTETVAYGVHNANDPATAWKVGLVKEVSVKRSSSILSKTVNVWEQGDWWGSIIQTVLNPRLKEVYVTNDVGQTKKTTYDYVTGSFSPDVTWNNPRIITEYGYDNEVLRKTQIDYIQGAGLTGSPDSSYQMMVRLQSSVKVYAPGDSLPSSRTDYEYDYYPLGWTPRSNPTMWDSSVTAFRGNLTKKTGYANAASASEAAEIKYGYDILGNVYSVTNPKGKSFITDYSNDNKYAYVTYTETPVPDPSGLSGSTSAFTTTALYDFNTGLPKTITNLNGQTVINDYNDPLNRLKKITQPNGAWVSFEYGDGQNGADTYLKTQTIVTSNQIATAYQFFDGKNRRTSSYESDGSEWITSDIQYDSMNRVWRVSNPYRKSSLGGVINPSNEWSITEYDDFGRVKKIKTPDNAEVNTSYSGNNVTVTDQSGKKRRSVANALGQLIRVDEPNGTEQFEDGNGNPVQPTGYTYDALGNLALVSQGVQTRTFVYDSLSRLKEATNPEAGTIKYTYDANGNLKTKRDARGIKTVYDYDNLDRVLKGCYRNIGTTAPLGMTTCTSNTETPEANTPDVAYTYDNITNAKGLLTKVTNGFSTTDYQLFDEVGRVTQSQQTTDGKIYDPMNYTYNLSGSMVEQKYPSGRVVKNVLDNDGDLSIVQSKKNANSGYWNYAKNFTYTAAGAVSSMQLGNGKWESTQFNSRLQPTQSALGTIQNGTDKLKLDFSYGTTQNNGNVISQTITVPTETRGGTTHNGFTATQNYLYDSLNRLSQAAEAVTPNGQPLYNSWSQTFTYDRYGNRRFNTADPNYTTTLPAGCQVAVCNPQIDPQTNKLIGYTFDNAGNTTVDAEGRTFTYDAKNKQTKVVNAQQQTVGEYFYDGDGNRVKKKVDDEVTIFVYNAGGQLVAEYATQIITTPQMSYLTADHLGSPRINTDASGAVIARHDYHPFGEEIAIARTSYGSDNVRQQFTSYERDNETNLDFAQARMFGSSVGRFTSPDPLLSSGRIDDPQTWNRYAYVLNNPLYYIDPDGLYECTGTPDQCKQFRTALADANAKLASIEKQYKKNSDEYRKAERALSSYGCESKGGNCVDEKGKNVTDATGKVIKDTSNIAVDFNLKRAGASTSLNGKIINISFNKSFGGGNPLIQGVVGNEGSNAADVQDFLKTGKAATRHQSEYNSSFVQAVVNEFVARDDKNWAYYSFTINPTKGRPRDIQVWHESWVTPDLKTLRTNRQNNINTFLKEDKLYLLTPTNKLGKTPIY